MNKNISTLVSILIALFILVLGGLYHTWGKSDDLKRDPYLICDNISNLNQNEIRRIICETEELRNMEIKYYEMVSRKKNFKYEFTAHMASLDACHDQACIMNVYNDAFSK